MAQGGKISMEGSSIYNGMFEDENFQMRHEKRGDLSMANKGPGTNSSQFFLTFVPCDWLNDKHVVFGHVVDGWEVLDMLE